MLPELKGRGLFVFSDPGGAKPLLSLIKLNSKIEEYLVISDRIYDFYSDFGIPVHKYRPNEEASLISRFNPDYIFTATSYTSKIEMKFIYAAKNKKIPTYSFIDHYTSYLERFYFNGVTEFPDFICVTDERAKGIGLKLNFLSSIIVTGNYYHDFLLQWKPSINKTDFFIASGIPLNHKLIVFAPDPLTNAGGAEKFGFDELSVYCDLIKAFKKLSNINFTFVIKLHPNQKSKNIVVATEASGLDNIIYGDTFHTNTLLYYSDLIIGMFSAILMEGELFHRNIIRYLKGLREDDPLEDLNIGVVAKDEQTLIQQIRSLLNKANYAEGN